MRKKFFARLGLILTDILIWHAKRCQAGARKKYLMYYEIEWKYSRDLDEALMLQYQFKEALK